MQKILLKKSKIYDNNSQGSRYRRNIVVFQLLSRVQLFTTLWIIAHQASLSMGFPMPEYWSGLSFLFPGDLPNPGIKPLSPALAGRFFTAELPEKPHIFYLLLAKIFSLFYTAINSSYALSSPNKKR